MPQGKRWTEAEDRKLRELAKFGLSSGRIAMRLERTAGAVCGRAATIGVKLKGRIVGPR